MSAFQFSDLGEMSNLIPQSGPRRTFNGRRVLMDVANEFRDRGALDDPLKRRLTSGFA
jgi:hypothetical protein